MCYPWARDYRRVRGISTPGSRVVKGSVAGLNTQNQLIVKSVEQIHHSSWSPLKHGVKYCGEKETFPDNDGELDSDWFEFL